MDGQTLEEGDGNPACSLEVEGNDVETGEVHGHSMVDAVHCSREERQGGADMVPGGTLVVWVAPPVNVTKTTHYQGVKRME